MIRIINNCVDCGKPCMHSACPYYERSYVCCDLCEAVIKPAEGRDYDDEDMGIICDRCLEKIQEGEEK